MKHIFSLILILFVFQIAISQTINTDQDPTSYCMGDTVKFTNASSVNFEACYWRFGDGTETWRENPVHIYQETGTFTVKLILTFSDATKDSTSMDITINPTPEITLIDEPIMQSLTAQTDGDDNTFRWYFNSSLTDETDDIIYYLEGGNYIVVATNSLNCSDSASIKIDVGGDEATTDSLSIVVKNNILTPDNADGANDVLFIENLSYFTSPVIINVFNKWGQLVYENSEYTNLGGFEGKSNSGKQLDAGTYYFIIKTEGRKTATGYIDLIR